MESKHNESPSSLGKSIERAMKIGEIQEELVGFIKNSKFTSAGFEGSALSAAALRQAAIDLPRMGIEAQWRIANHIIDRTSEDYNDFLKSDEEKQLIYIRRQFDALEIDPEFRDKIIAEFNQGAKCYAALGFYINLIQEQLRGKGISFIANDAFQRTLFQFEKKTKNRVAFMSEIKLIKIKGQIMETDNISPPLEGDFLILSNSFNFVYDLNSREMHIEQVEAQLTPGVDFKLYLEKKANELLIKQKNKIYDFEEKSTFEKLWIILNLFNIIRFIQINMKLEKLERAASENLNEILPALGILNQEEMVKDHDQIFNSLLDFIEKTVYESLGRVNNPVVQQEGLEQSASLDSAYDRDSAYESGYESEDNPGSNTGKAAGEQKEKILEEVAKTLAPDFQAVSKEVSSSQGSVLIRRVNQAGSSINRD